MPSAFAPLSRDALFAHLAQGAPGRPTVVTPNRRLAAALLRDYDRDRVQAGLARWESADILPWTAFVERLWDEAIHAPGAALPPLLLASAEEEALWESVVGDSRHAATLASATGAASQAREAWRLLQSFRLGEAVARAPASEDGRAFRDWAFRYERLTRERGFTDAARLADGVRERVAAGDVAPPGLLVLYGFDRLAPQQRDLVEALRERGADVVAGEPPRVDGRRIRTEWPTPREELAAAAAWARARLEESLASGREPRIGLVVPDLGQRREAVRRALENALHPAGAEGAAFELSLGKPLSAFGVVHEALALLTLLGPDVPFETASRVLRSPFLAGAQEECDARARLDADLRERAPFTTTLDRLLALARSAPASAGAPRLLASLEALSTFRRDRLFGPRAAPDWARAFAEALAIAGWPGERPLDSATFQCIAKWHETLAGFARLERVLSRTGYRDARARLARLAADTLFQPESPEVPVVVMGILESAGLAFDHLWVMGLTDEAWPLAARPNPFLPVAVQRAAGIPESDAALSLALDRRLTQGWLDAAPDVVLSHARAEGETELAPSPLVVPVALEAGFAVKSAVPWRERLRLARRTEPWRDERGPAFDSHAGRGGTAIFRDQAACPFRAFAAHRLGSRALETPRPGLGAADRGTLLHHVLAAAWKRLGNKATLEATSDAGLAAILAEAAREATERLARRRPHALEGRHERLERERLAALATQWLAHEREREDFTVVAIEREITAAFGGIAVKAKLDRLDRLASGGEAVIDYKTGEAAVRAWLGPRPDDPQLPLYALASGDDVAALAFARVRAGDCRFEGLSRTEGLLPRVQILERNRSRLAKGYTGWPDLLANWRAELEALGEAFAAGDARVDPKDGARTCERCDQFLVCRVAERAVAPADPEEGVDE